VRSHINRLDKHNFNFLKIITGNSLGLSPNTSKKNKKQQITTLLNLPKKSIKEKKQRTGGKQQYFRSSLSGKLFH
jgi:hypothetical protein